MPGSLGMLSTPGADLLVPSDRSDQRVEQRLVGKLVASRDPLAVIADFLAVGKFLRRHEPGFFEQRQIAVGVVVALHAWVAVPVPDAAEAAAMIDVADVLHPRLVEVVSREDAAEAG